MEQDKTLGAQVCQHQQPGSTMYTLKLVKGAEDFSTQAPSASSSLPPGNRTLSPSKRSPSPTKRATGRSSSPAKRNATPGRRGIAGGSGMPGRVHGSAVLLGGTEAHKEVELDTTEMDQHVGSHCMFT